MRTKSLRAFQEYIRSDCRKNVILDTDAYNEVDDQFCIAYLMKRPDQINLLSMNAAPFYKPYLKNVEQGMEESYREILNIQKLVDPDSKIPVYRGSPIFMPDRNTPVESEACDNIIKTLTGER